MVLQQQTGEPLNGNGPNAFVFIVEIRKKHLHHGCALDLCRGVSGVVTLRLRFGWLRPEGINSKGQHSVENRLERDLFDDVLVEGKDHHEHGEVLLGEHRGLGQHQAHAEASERATAGVGIRRLDRRNDERVHEAGELGPLQRIRRGQQEVLCDQKARHHDDRIVGRLTHRGGMRRCGGVVKGLTITLQRLNLLLDSASLGELLSSHFPVELNFAFVQPELNSGGFEQSGAVGRFGLESCSRGNGVAQVCNHLSHELKTVGLGVANHFEQFDGGRHDALGETRGEE
mmetsp:Transcript_27773/g.83074  ORF Transcript_27773/g.83074 Transcript_27773/m.83074 type:complete len:286 (-) Transcript_27773:361-1218(-)